MGEAIQAWSAHTCHTFPLSDFDFGVALGGFEMSNDLEAGSIGVNIGKSHHTQRHLDRTLHI